MKRLFLLLGNQNSRGPGGRVSPCFDRFPGFLGRMRSGRMRPWAPMDGRPDSRLQPGIGSPEASPEPDTKTRREG
jgi:hypothetical protein